MLFGARISLFQNKEDNVQISAYYEINDDKAMVFLSWQLGVFVHAKVSFKLKILEDRTHISSVLQSLHCTDEYFLVDWKMDTGVVILETL